MTDPRAPFLRVCQCGHSILMHEIGVRKGVEVRTYCFVQTAKGLCGCMLFVAGNPTGLRDSQP